MQQPPVVLWFKVYAALMAVLYLVCGILGPFIIVFGERWLEMERGEALITGIVLTAMCWPFFVIYAAALVLKPKPWVWIYDLVLIAGGFTSCCTLPFSIALLVFWLKPDNKAYFGRV